MDPTPKLATENSTTCYMCYSPRCVTLQQVQHFSGTLYTSVNNQIQIYSLTLIGSVTSHI